MSIRRRVAWGLVATSLFTLPSQQLPQAAAAGAQYVSGGTAVARANGQTAADEGVVVCDNGNGVGVGGFCLPFGGGDAIEVADEALGENVAFQVCVDNSGDGVCTSPDFGACADVVVFSHDDAGNFFNPLGPVPTGFASGCTGGPWKGYVVLLCEGVHAGGVSDEAHQHTASSGTGNVVSGGEGLGNFCGGSPIQQSRKPYKVGSGARYTSGGTVVARNNGEPAVDEGTMLCNGGDNVGVGGFCTSFGGGDAMAVFDDVAGTDVAFQVCIDNNGDGTCTSPDTSAACPDQIFFSHDDQGVFYNPLGPIPTGFLPGCGYGAWQGYVVFLCEGTHVAGTPHAHAATTGGGRVTTGGEGLGTFCGGSEVQPSRKKYQLDAYTPPPTGVLTADGRCRIGAAGNEQVTGGQGTFTGVAEGEFASNDPTAFVTIRCFVSVNGVEVASTQTGAGTGAAATQGQVTLTKGPEDEATICAEITENGVGFTDCVPLTQSNIPPQAVVDLIEQFVATVEDLT